MPRTARRASAIKASRALAEAGGSENDDNFEPDEEDELRDKEDKEEWVRPTTKKGRKSGGGAAPKVKGALKDLLDLPLEIVTLIVSHLDLPTVFHLSRLNKRFYRFLRDPTLEYIWEGAREESGLPKLTAEGMDVYGFANLLFGGHCQGCGKATTKVDYVLRLRTCKSCSAEFIRDGHEEDFLFDWKVRDRFARAVGRGLRTTGRLDRRRREAEKEDDSGYDSDESLDEDGEDEEDICQAAYAGWRSLKTEDDWSAFVDSCVALQNARDNGSPTDADAIISWQRDREDEKEQEKQGIRDRRRQAIEDRLTERGWLPHHFESDEFKHHSLVNVAKDLNDKAWSGMRVQLEKILENAEEQSNQRRIAEEATRREEHLRQEHGRLSKDIAAMKAVGLYPLPCWDEVVALPSVQELFKIDSVESSYASDPTFEDNADTLAAELVVRRTDLKKALFDRLLVVIKKVEGVLGVSSSSSSAPAGSTSTSSVKLLPDPISGSQYSQEEIDEFLSRAVALVSCRTCRTLDTIPRLFTHSCKNRWSLSDGVSLADSKYDVSPEYILGALKACELAGKSVDAMASEMDNLGPGFSCTDGECAGCIALPWQLFAKHLSGYPHYPIHLKTVRGSEKRGEPMNLAGDE
ncbi:hypothetical protein JCM8097_002219 [Rhodosporidiobolus ruineniae]